MSKGMIMILASVILFVCGAMSAGAEVYKVVDKDGNVTYTDQVPTEGAKPMTLPEISVVETAEYPEESVSEAGETDESEDEPSSPRELRRMYRDFQIVQPSQEETVVGTGNTVNVAWGASAAYQPGMSVSVFVDGQSHAGSPQGNMSFTLERGEHQVYAVLHDARGRRIVTSPTVTFFVRQHSALFNNN